MLIHVIANILTNAITQYGLFFLLDSFVPSRFSFRRHRLVFALLVSLITSLGVYLVDARYRFLFNVAVYFAFICLYSKAKPFRYLLLLGMYVILCTVAEIASYFVLAGFGWDSEAYTLTSWWL